MGAAVVAVGVHVVVHRGRLRVLAELVVVVRGARGLHRAQRDPGDVGAEQPGPDQPVRLLGRLLQRVLLDQRAEDVRHRFVQGARLPAVGQVRRVLGDPVGQLVADDVHRHGEVEEEVPVSVAEDHLLAVPEGVVVVLAVVDGRVQGESGVVDRAPAEALQEQFVRRPEPRVGAVDGGVLAQRVALPADLRPGQPGAVLGVVDGPLRIVGGRRGQGGDDSPDGGDPAPGAQQGVAFQGALGEVGAAGVLGQGGLVQEVRRYDRAEDGVMAARVGGVHARQCGSGS